MIRSPDATAAGLDSSACSGVRIASSVSNRSSARLRAAGLTTRRWPRPRPPPRPPLSTTTRAVKVEALRPWSIVRTVPFSTALARSAFRPLAREHVQVVGGDPEAGIRGNRCNSLAEAVERGRQRRKNAGRRCGATSRRTSAGLAPRRPHPLRRAEQGDSCAELIERRCRRRRHDDPGAALGQLLRQLGQLCDVGGGRGPTPASGSSPSKRGCQTSSKLLRFSRQLRRVVLPVVEETLHAATDPTAVSAATTPSKPRGTSVNTPSTGHNWETRTRSRSETTPFTSSPTTTGTWR